MRRALIALAVLLAVLGPGRPASAHTALVSSDPARDARLATAPATVTLTFSQRLNPDFTTIAVSDAARQRVPTSAAAVDGARGTVIFDRPPGNGAYTVAYRVVSADGHTVQGSYPFTVADPAGPVPVPSATAAAVAAPAAGGPPAGVWIGLGAGVAVLAALLYAVARRRSRSATGA